MSLVFAAITPHPPLLVPSIGKDNVKKITKTKQALEKLEEELYLSHPDTIVIVSSHAPNTPKAFTINFCSEYNTDFKEFGDISTKASFKGDMNLPYHIREAAKQDGFETIMVSQNTLDHGTAIPLLFLTPHLPGITILPIGFSDVDNKTHLDFGYLIKEQIMKTNKRVAVIASGDLSHALTTDAPAGFNAKGVEFDQKIQELLATRNTTGMLQMNNEYLTEAAECGFRSFLILMGILRNINYTFESYAYESPFGVGYLTANFTL